MRTLPNGVEAYRKTDIFTDNTVPSALLRDHSTKKSVWGLLHVIRGEVTYCITEPGAEEIVVLSPNQCGVIAPEQKHYIEVDQGTEFFVEFYR